MILEIESAVNYLEDLIRMSKQNVSEYTLNKFNKNLLKELKLQFSDHWSPSHPYLGTGARCIRINKKIDPRIVMVCKSIGLSFEDIYLLFPKDFIMWIDPQMVSCRHSNGPTCILYDNDSIPWQSSKKQRKNCCYPFKW